MPYPSPYEKIQARKDKVSCFGCLFIIVLAFFLAVFLTLLVGPGKAQAAAITGQSVYAATNADRKAHGLKPVVPNAALVKAAQLKANDMMLRGYFAHASPEGWHAYHWVNIAKGKQWEIGENLADGFTTIEAQESALMKSPTHRANILEKTYTEIGIGIAHRPDGTIITAVYFGAE